MSTFKSIAYSAPRVVTFHQPDATIPATGYAFVADEYYKLISVKVRFSHVGGSSAAVTLTKDPSGTASGGGTAMLSATVDLTATADTTYSGSPVTTNDTLHIAPGDAISVKFSGTLTALTGLVVQFVLKPTRTSNIVR